MLMAYLTPRILAVLAVFLSTVADRVLASPPGVTWKERVEVASGGGYQGPWRMNESVYRYVDDPTVAINSQGLIGVAWADQARKDIFFQICTSDLTNRFEEPVDVSGSPSIFSWLPRIVITDAEPPTIAMLWQEIVFSGGTHGGEILFAHSVDGGKTFSAPQNLSNDIAGSGKGRLTERYWHNGSLDLAIGSENALYAAWTEYEGTLWFSRSSDGGKSFSRPLRIAGTNVEPARGPSLASGPEGKIYVAWTVGEDPTADIHIAKSVDRGQSFDEPRIVFSDKGHSDAPKIALDSTGTLHLVYANSPDGVFQRYHIDYTRSRDGGRTFDVPKRISTSQAKTFESAGFPGLGLDGEDNLYVLWERFPRLGGRPQGLGFTYSTDRGRTFATPSMVPGTRDPTLGVNGSLQGLLMQKLAVNRTGAIAVVNSTFKNNETSHIWLFPGQSRLQ